MEDFEIIEAYWSRNEAAIDACRQKHGTFLTRIAFNILQNHEDSEECVDDVYMKAWNTIPPQRPASLAAYLGRIARNLSINRWHEKHAQKRGGGAEALLSELADCIPAADSVEAQIETKALTCLLNRWLYELPRDDRVLFLRRYWFGDSVKALAMACAASPNQTAGRLYRLRQKLKTILEKEGVSL